MRTLVLVCLSVFIMALAVSPALADETITVVADSTYAGNAGFLVQTSDSEGFGQTLFVGPDAGKVRIYASREFGSQVWEDFPGAQYLVPMSSLNIGDTWRFMNSDNDLETIAEVTALENISVVVGTFSAYRVDVAEVASPSVIIETMWFADGVGFVRNQGYLGGSLDWRDDLSSFTIVGGSGFMPMAVGNTWFHVFVSVPTENTSLGGLKSQYR